MNTLPKLKICYIAGTLGQGGSERQLLYALRALRQGGTNVRVLSLDRGAFWEEPIRQLGVEVRWVGEQQSRLKRLFRITRELKANPPDLVQSQHFFANVYACVAAGLLGLTGIGALRNNGVYDMMGSGWAGGRLNLRVPRMLAANSLAAIRHAMSEGVRASRLFFLPNVVDTDRFKPWPTSSVEPLTLLTVGRFAREKRFDRFLRILAQLRNVGGLNVRGLIVGPARSGHEIKSRLERMASELGLLPEGVQFRPGNGNLVPFYQGAAVYVLTSDYEGTPNVLLEAMASGLPIVATNVGGVPEIVSEGQTGFLFEPDDIPGQVTALTRLVNDVQLRRELGQRGRTYVEQNHSVERLPDCLIRLYDYAFATRRSSRLPVTESRVYDH